MVKLHHERLTTCPSIATDWLIECQHCLFAGYHWGSGPNSGGNCVSRISDGVLVYVVFYSSVCAAVFAFAHLTPGEFPQLFVLGVALGFSYAQTRNLLTPITMHAVWNSGVILLLTFLQLQGYNIKELMQAS